MPTIICGFPGVGKSWLFNNQEELGIKVIDSDSSKFSWSSPGVRNPDFPDNYMEHIKSQTDPKLVIMVSTHREVLDALHKNELNPIIIYPDVTLKKDYLRRYRKRGNDDKFIDMLSKNWDNFIGAIDNDSRFRKYKLTHPDEFLRHAPINTFMDCPTALWPESLI